MCSPSVSKYTQRYVRSFSGVATRKDQFFSWPAWALPCFTNEFPLFGSRKLRQSRTLLFLGVASAQDTKWIRDSGGIIIMKSAFSVSILTQHPLPPPFFRPLSLFRNGQKWSVWFCLFPSSSRTEEGVLCCVYCGLCVLLSESTRQFC